MRIVHRMLDGNDTRVAVIQNITSHVASLHEILDSIGLG